MPPKKTAEGHCIANIPLLQTPAKGCAKGYTYYKRWVLRLSGKNQSWILTVGNRENAITIGEVTFNLQSLSEAGYYSAKCKCIHLAITEDKRVFLIPTATGGTHRQLACTQRTRKAQETGDHISENVAERGPDHAEDEVTDKDDESTTAGRCGRSSGAAEPRQGTSAHAASPSEGCGSAESKGDSDQESDEAATSLSSSSNDESSESGQEDCQTRRPRAIEQIMKRKSSSSGDGRPNAENKARRQGMAPQRQVGRKSACINWTWYDADTRRFSIFSPKTNSTQFLSISSQGIIDVFALDGENATEWRCLVRLVPEQRKNKISSASIAACGRLALADEEGIVAVMSLMSLRDQGGADDDAGALPLQQQRQAAERNLNVHACFDLHQAPTCLAWDSKATRLVAAAPLPSIIDVESAQQILLPPPIGISCFHKNCTFEWSVWHPDDTAVALGGKGGAFWWSFQQAAEAAGQRDSRANRPLLQGRAARLLDVDVHSAAWHARYGLALVTHHHVHLFFSGKRSESVWCSWPISEAKAACAWDDKSGALWVIKKTTFLRVGPGEFFPPGESKERSTMMGDVSACCITGRRLVCVSSAGVTSLDLETEEKADSAESF